MTSLSSAHTHNTKKERIKMKKVLVTTHKRGVFAGRLAKTEHIDGETVVYLKDARMVLHWPNGGVHSACTRTDFEGHKLGAPCPGLRIGFVDSIADMEKASYKAIMSESTHEQ